MFHSTKGIENTDSEENSLLIQRRRKKKSPHVILVTDKILIIRTMCNMNNKNPEKHTGIQAEDLKRKAAKPPKGFHLSQD